MNHDYTVRLHYSIVEFGGFLRFPFGVEPDQLVSMCVQERANLVAHNAMCSGQYLNLVRLRAFVEGGETTDVVMERNQNMGETAESEELSDDELTPAKALENPSVTTLMEVTEAMDCRLILAAGRSCTKSKPTTVFLYHGRREAHFGGET